MTGGQSEQTKGAAGQKKVTKKGISIKAKVEWPSGNTTTVMVYVNMSHFLQLVALTIFCGFNESLLN